MNTFKDKINAAFRDFANMSGLPIFTRAGKFIEIIGVTIGLRVRWNVERLEGVFVTIFRKSQPENEYSITYLIEYEGGDSRDIESSKSDDIQEIISLVKQYTIQLLTHDCNEKFEDFESYAQKRIIEQIPSLPTIKATRWIRPEWL